MRYRDTKRVCAGGERDTGGKMTTQSGPESAVTDRGLNRLIRSRSMNIVPPQECELPECTAPRYQAHRMCGSHYMKWYRHGDPRWIKPVQSVDLTGQRFGTLVAAERCDVNHWTCVCDCGRERRVRTWSLTSGGTQTCNYGHHRAPSVGYSSAHQRLARDLGPASQYACVDCSSPARQWSYNHDDINEMASDFGPYSLKSEHYSPRCVPCHKSFDLTRLGKAAH